MLKIIFLLLILLSVFKITSTTKAQEQNSCLMLTPTSVFLPQKNLNLDGKKISFPIPSLGYCTSLAQCQIYCDNPKNISACISYAKSSGLYTDESLLKESIKKAKTELGCNSLLECRKFCDKKENYNKCSDFAKKNNLSGGGLKKVGTSLNTVSNPSPSPNQSTAPKVVSTPAASQSTSTPIPSVLTTPASSAISNNQTSDGSFCTDSDAGAYDKSGTCTDASGVHADYCNGSAAIDWYCAGEFVGSNWKNKHCIQTSFVCSSISKACVSGACQTSTRSVQGAKTQNLAQANSLVQNKNTKNLSFPIPQLNNCTNCGECQSFCQDTKNQGICQKYLQDNNLLKQEEQVKKQLLVDTQKDLGCNSLIACKNYCTKEENWPKCLDFSYSQGIISGPALISPLSDITVTGKSKIKFKGIAEADIQISLQPLSDSNQTLLLNYIRKDDGKIKSIEWDSANFPNSKYHLILESNIDNQQTLIATSQIEINNTQTEQSANTKYPKIITASDFNPKLIAIDPQTKVSRIENRSDQKDNSLSISFQGHTQPNQFVNLLIFSNPIVVTVKSDINGVWKYNLRKPLDPGKHIVYAAIVKPDGTKVRSEVSEFVISQVSAADNNAGLILASAPENPSTKNYLLVSIFLITLAASVLISILLFKTRKLTSGQVTLQDETQVPKL